MKTAAAQHSQDTGLIHNPRCFTWDYGGGDLDYPVFILLPLLEEKVLIQVVQLSQGNKGGVSVRFSFYGHMLCFLNCHLAAHMNYALQRVDELEYILEAQDFDLTDTPHIRDHK